MTYELFYHGFSLDEWITVTSVLTYSEVKVFYYLLASNPMGDRQIDCRIRTIAKALNISTGAVSTAIKRLEEMNLIDASIFGLNRSDTERQIRDRLKNGLGGQVEVVTAVGRIDLLTEFEVIEIKEISDWKEALGKILAYSAFFPSHSKRIHLFGRASLAKLALAQSTCFEFGVTVNFEEVSE